MFASRCVATLLVFVCSSASIALGQGSESGIGIRHRGNLAGRIEDARRVLGLAHRFYEETEPKIDRLAAVCAADRDRDVRRERPHGRGVPETEDAEPETIISSAVAPGRPLMPADGQVNPPPRTEQFVGDLGQDQ